MVVKGGDKGNRVVKEKEVVHDKGKDDSSMSGSVTKGLAARTNQKDGWMAQGPRKGARAMQTVDDVDSLWLG